MKERGERDAGCGGDRKSQSHGVTVIRLADLDISRMQSSRWQQIARVPEPVFERYIEQGRKLESYELTTTALRTLVRYEERRARVAQMDAPPALPADQKYPIIYADPPWRFEHVMTESRAIEDHYPTMALEDICALPVADVAAEHSVLLLWSPAGKLAEAMRVIEAWGFEYRTDMVWVKDRIGAGYYVRQQHENLLIARRGELPLPLPEDRLSSVITAPRAEHSVKPVEFYERIERMYPELQKIELFARGTQGLGRVGRGGATRRGMSGAHENGSYPPGLRPSRVVPLLCARKDGTTISAGQFEALLHGKLVTE
jgi:N6-adenosine-specific RNA methylase IME4